jgi:hypothetical protein
MTPEENLRDLRRHADDFARRVGFTFTVLDPDDNGVIGCVYLYPSASEECDVTVQSWVRADRHELDAPLSNAIAPLVEAVPASRPYLRRHARGRVDVSDVPTL